MQIFQVFVAISLISSIAFIFFYFKKRRARLSAGQNYKSDVNYIKASKTKRILGVVTVTSYIIACLLSQSSLKNSEEPIFKAQQVKMTHNEKSIMSAGKADNITLEQAQDIIAAMNKCGFDDNIQSIKKDEGLDNWEGVGEKGYRLKLDNQFNNFIIYLAPNNSVYKIRWANRDFYSDNEAHYNKSDFVCTKEEEIGLISNAQKIVKTHLAVPKSANFEKFNWTIAKNPEEYYIKSSVEYTNAFNAKFEEPFEIKINRQTNNVEWLSIGSNIIIDQ